MKILLLGYSNLAKRRIIPALKKIKSLRFDIASVSSTPINNGHKVWYNNYTEALNKSDADVVYISLVNSMHFYFANKAISLGKHVIVDKPLALNNTQILKLIDSAKKKKILLAEALTFNYHKQFSYLQNVIKRNNPITNIIMKFNIPKPRIHDTKLSNKLGGGCFNDMMSYASEINRIFLKNNISIKSFIHTYKNKMSNSFSINTSNKKIEFYGFFSHNTEYENSITLSSTDYSIRLDRFCAPPPVNNLFVRFQKKNNTKIIKIKKDDIFKNFLNEYLMKLKKKKFNYYHNKILFNSRFKHNLIKNYR